VLGPFEQVSLGSIMPLATFLARAQSKLVFLYFSGPPHFPVVKLVCECKDTVSCSLSGEISPKAFCLLRLPPANQAPLFFTWTISMHAPRAYANLI